MQRVAIIDYGSGNLRSAHKAFQRAAGTDHEVTVTADPAQIAAADRIVLPGVGAFGDCRAGLLAVPGLYDALAEAVLRKGRPFIGICVGMQLLAERGLEHGDHQGLGWVRGTVERLQPSDPALKVPHMGWNELATAPHPLFAGLPPAAHVYFVHSYHMRCADAADVVATTDYGQTVTAAIARGNIAGLQFHPEKSQAAGLTIIANFLKWKP